MCSNVFRNSSSVSTQKPHILDTEHAIDVKLGARSVLFVQSHYLDFCENSDMPNPVIILIEAASIGVGKTMSVK